MNYLANQLSYHNKGLQKIAKEQHVALAKKDQQIEKMNEYLAALKNAHSLKVSDLENTYKQRYQRAQERLTVFESGSGELADILRTYNDQMGKVEAESDRCMKMVREIVQLQFSNLKLEIEDYMQSLTDSTAEKRIKLIEYNFKKMQ